MLEKYDKIIVGDFMTLKFCEDNFLFYITHTKYFDILCYFVIILLIFLFLLVQKNNFLKKINESNFKKVFIIFVSGIFVSFFIFIFILLLNKETFYGCSTKYYQNIYSKVKNSFIQKIDSISNSKLIVVGDSRMQLINDDEKIVKPFNMQFVAKGGAKMDWLENIALPKVYKILNNNEFNYYVLVNMGVNDLNSNLKVEEIVEDYFKLYSKLAEKFSNVKVYIMSVNPINEEKRNKTEPNNKRTTEKIKLFNKLIREKLKDSNLKNMYYCDAYNNLKFDTNDGLHYTQETNEDIIYYISNKCIDY